VQSTRIATIIENIIIAEATHYLQLKVEATSETMGSATFEPGQFLQIWCADNWPMFEPDNQPTRPFAILGNSETPEFRLLVRDRGPRTHWLTRRKPGEQVRFYGPLGQGFNLLDINNKNRVLLVAEAIGVVQLAEVARRLLTQGHNVSVLATAPGQSRVIPLANILGEAKVSYQVQISDKPAEKLAEILMQPEYQNFDRVFLSLAPRTYPFLLKAGVLGRPGSLFENPQIYLQKTLNCGIGSCGQCQIETVSGSRLVCTDGPVFRLQEVNWRTK